MINTVTTILFTVSDCCGFFFSVLIRTNTLTKKTTLEMERVVSPTGKKTGAVTTMKRGVSAAMTVVGIMTTAAVTTTIVAATTQTAAVTTMTVAATIMTAEEITTIGAVTTVIDVATMMTAETKTGTAIAMIIVVMTMTGGTEMMTVTMSPTMTNHLSPKINPNEGITMTKDPSPHPSLTLIFHSTPMVCLDCFINVIASS